MREIEVSKRTYDFMVRMYEEEGLAFSLFKYWLTEDTSGTDTAYAFREMSRKTGDVPSVFLHQLLTGELKISKEESKYVFWIGVGGVKLYYAIHGTTEDFTEAEEFYEEENTQEIKALEILGWNKQKIN